MEAPETTNGFCHVTNFSTFEEIAIAEARSGLKPGKQVPYSEIIASMTSFIIPW